MDEFGTARRNAVVRGFIEALTRGGKFLYSWYVFKKIARAPVKACTNADAEFWSKHF